MPRQTLVQAMIEAIPQPAIFVQVDERIGAANKDAAAILGEGLVGRHYITALRQPSVLDAIERCAKTTFTMEARYLGNEGGRETTFDLRCVFVDASDHAGVLVTFTDRTDAEEITNMRRDFVANVSHELRTPLTAVMGFIETLQGPAKGDPNAQDRFLTIMARETARMNRLVGDLLSLNRVESEARRRPTENVEMDELLASVVHTLSAMADDKNARLNLQFDAEGVHVPGDPDQLRQVFTNLIENALKYGGADVEVTIRMGAPSFEPRLRAVATRISVCDTGPGFDPVHIPRLTERFYRIDSHRSREMGGTGLGLAIVKHIINRHRGRLKIHSQIDQGSEFTVLLPVIEA